MPFVDPNFFKDQFGVEGKTVLLTFGLLSPNKGIEYAIEALPQILERHPEVVYIVLGATHPNLLAREGETYRLRLERLAEARGVKSNVIFYNRYVTLEELQEFIGAADIYLTPYLNEAQITSGTLSYAFGAGKAVISTPYWHAFGIGLGHQQIAQMSDQVGHQPAEIFARFRLGVNEGERLRHVAIHQVIAQRRDRFTSGEPKYFQHIRFVDWITTECHQLIEHRFRVTHATFRSARQCLGRRSAQPDIFFCSDFEEMLFDQRNGNAFEIEALAPAENGGGDFFDVGRGENEFHVRRRFLERLEKRIK